MGLLIIVYEGTSGCSCCLWCFGCFVIAGASKSEAIQALVDTAKDLGTSGRDDVLGHGLIQIDDALQSLLNATGTCRRPFGWRFDHY